MKLSFGILAVLVFLTLAAAGCGSGDEGAGEGTNDGAATAASGKPLTKAEFIKRADKICEQVDETQKAAFRNYLAKNPDAVVDQSLNEELVAVIGLPPLQSEVSQLDALPVPAGDEEEVEAIVEGLADAVEKGEEDPALLVNLENGGSGPFTAVGKLAGEYGLKACALPL